MKKSIPWQLFVSGGVGVLLLTTVLRAAFSDPPTAPRASDSKKAQRELTGAAPDERVALPSGSAVAGNGIIEPADRETKVSGQLGGRISVIHVQEGQAIEAGAVLIELDGTVEKSAWSAAEAEVEGARAELTRTSRGLRSEDVDAIAAEAAAAKARAELTSGTLSRTEALAKGGATTVDELDRARRQAAIDEMSARAAEARRRAAQAGSRTEDVLLAQAKLRAAEGRRDQARAVFERLLIRAPISGEVLSVKYRAGEYWSPTSGDPLLILGDTRKLRVRIDIDERDVSKVKLGAAGYATLNAFPGRKFPGKVVEIGRRMGRKNVRSDDPTERIDTKILEVILELDEKSELIPGLRVLAFVSTSPSA